MKRRPIWNLVGLGALLAAGVCLPRPAQAAGRCQAPDVSVFFGAHLFVGGPSEQPGPTIATTIDDYWAPGPCTYRADGRPEDACDRLRFGLALYRGPAEDAAGMCIDPVNPAVAPQEDGGSKLTDGGQPYQIANLQTEAGNYFCADDDQRTPGESALTYRDYRLQTELATNWPDRPQLSLSVLKDLPQSDTEAKDRVRKTLLAACELYEGKGNQHLSMPSWVMSTPDSSEAVSEFAGMLAAAGGTGQCCYKAAGGDCDPTDPADVIDMCAHVRADPAGGAVDHDEATIRRDIADRRYECAGAGNLAQPGALDTNNFADVKCQLTGSPCDGSFEPAELWSIFSCIQLRPESVAPEDLTVEYCGEIAGNKIRETGDDDDDTEDDGDDRNSSATAYDDPDGDGCIELTVGNGIEYVDDSQNLYYLSADELVDADDRSVSGIDDKALCRGIASGDAWTTTTCPNEHQLCDLGGRSQCSLGQVQCINGAEVCTPYAGNQSCKSSACAQEQVYDAGISQTNIQLLVDRSYSMALEGRWAPTRRVARRLADWNYVPGECSADGSGCDKAHLGVYFWDHQTHSTDPAFSARENATTSDIDDAFGIDPGTSTHFHQAAKMVADDPNLADSSTNNASVFITDGRADDAFTAREAVRRFCRLKDRPKAPITTYSVGFQGGSQNVNSLIAASGGTGSCCFATDGACDSEPQVSPCQLYEYELANGSELVAEFDSWIASSPHAAKWREITRAHASYTGASGDRFDHGTADSYNAASGRGAVADDLDMVADMARFLYANTAGSPDPDDIDCAIDAGDATASPSNPAPFYRHIICEMHHTLSYVLRHRYAKGGRFAEDYDLSDYQDLERVDLRTVTTDHNYLCTGAKQADDEGSLQLELQSIVEDASCSYPLVLPAGMDNTPAFAGASHVRLYMPNLGGVVAVPHLGNGDGSSFANELTSLGVANAGRFADDGWEFATAARTSVKLSKELCSLTRTDTVAKVTTQVCRICDPAKVGTSCRYVTCSPDRATLGASAPALGDVAATADGRKCRFSEFPCPDNPDRTCTGWTKSGRCGAGTYICDDRGFAYCEQSRSPMPEICNGRDDDCDGDIDDLSANDDQWTDPKYEITGESYDGWYCGYHDTCTCPGGAADPNFGTTDDPDEFTAMLSGQQLYADSTTDHCQCGEGVAAAGAPAYRPTRTYSPDSPATEPKAGCSNGGREGGPIGPGGTAFLLGLLGLFGWRKQRR